MEILSIKNIDFCPDDSREPILKNITLSIQQGSFNIICGRTGSGKTSLLELMYEEAIKGRSDREKAMYAGYVYQRPEQQIVMDKVWHELAFGLENTEMETALMRRRISEVCGYFGMEDIYDSDINSLSGGQKQLLNLASVIAMDPKILFLDEPTAQLDPVAAGSFVDKLVQLNQDTGITVVVAEHNLDKLLKVADRVIYIDNGMVKIDETPNQFCECITKDDPMYKAMPAPVRLYHALNATGTCPLSIRDGRYLIEQYGDKISSFDDKKMVSHDPVIECKDVWFRYEKNSEDVLKGTTFDVNKNEIFCILGENGSGKTTCAQVICGLLKNYAGKILINNRKIRKPEPELITCLPQDILITFHKDTVQEELMSAYNCRDYIELKKRLPLFYDPERILNTHPYDLSGGEQQLCGLIKLMADPPDIVILDEPTKGIDAEYKELIREALLELKSKGKTIIIITHDIEFAGTIADRCGMFFRGQMVTVDSTRDFMNGNMFYSTGANRMTRGHYDHVLTVEEAAKLCIMNSVKS